MGRMILIRTGDVSPDDPRDDSADVAEVARRVGGRGQDDGNQEGQEWITA